MRLPAVKPSRVKVLETLALLSLLSLLVNQLLLQRVALLWLAILLLAVALFVRPLAQFIVLCWLQFSKSVSNFNSKVILTLIFFLVLTPVAFVYRLFNKDPLNLRRDQSGSYYSERNHTFDKSDLEKMW